MKKTRRQNGQLLFNESPVLTRYIRDKNNNKIGMIVSLLINNEIRYGFSLTNIKKGDSFNREKAISICVGRAINHPEIQEPFNQYQINGENVNIPTLARKSLVAMYYRSKNYFKFITP